MSIESQDNNLQDDQVLAKLYKEGAKDTPPAKLNSEILNYAADANKSSHSTSASNGVGNNAVSSHFSGGWKVPLSMAASVVVVFALLVQLDQTPQQLELPPIPEISTPVESKKADTKDETLKGAPALEETSESEDIMMDDAVDEAVSGTQDTKETDFDSALETEAAQESIVEELIIQKTQTPTLQKPEQQPSREQVQQVPVEVTKPVDIQRTEERRLENRSNQAAPSAPTSNSSKSKSLDGYVPKIDKAQTKERPSQEPTSALESKSTVTSGSVAKERSMKQQSAPTREDALGASDMATDIATESEMEGFSNLEQEYAPIPVEDWLLMIERLVARKDYAEAARQLQKFKQAHPKVNVDDLESKIP